MLQSILLGTVFFHNKDRNLRGLKCRSVKNVLMGFIASVLIVTPGTGISVSLF